MSHKFVEHRSRVPRSSSADQSIGARKGKPHLVGQLHAAERGPAVAFEYADADEPSIETALAVAPRFGITAPEAKRMLREVLETVTTWRKIGRKLTLNGSTLDDYESSFRR